MDVIRARPLTTMLLMLSPLKMEAFWRREISSRLGWLQVPGCGAPAIGAEGATGCCEGVAGGDEVNRAERVEAELRFATAVEDIDVVFCRRSCAVDHVPCVVRLESCVVLYCV